MNYGLENSKYKKINYESANVFEGVWFAYTKYFGSIALGSSL